MTRSFALSFSFQLAFPSARTEEKLCPIAFHRRDIRAVDDTIHADIGAEVCAIRGLTGIGFRLA